MSDYTEEARVLRAIATWADNAADLYEDIESEYDQASTYATACRQNIIQCTAMMFKLMVEAPGDLRWRIARGMARMVDFDVLACGCPKEYLHQPGCPGDDPSKEGDPVV